MTTPPLTRDGAAHAAHEELSKHVYQQARPSVGQEALSAVWRWLLSAYDRIVSVTPGGAVGLLVIVAVLAAAAVVFAQRRGVARGLRGRHTGLETPADATPGQLRAEADAFAARGQWAEAVRARLRAVVRTFEERGILDARPGRTAAEVAAEAGSARPEWREGLFRAAQAFGEIWYGHRPATAADDALLRELDEAVRRPRSGVAATAGASSSFATAPPR
jgi:Domain of unknown function (DUF4129)